MWGVVDFVVSVILENALYCLCLIFTILGLLETCPKGKVSQLRVDRLIHEVGDKVHNIRIVRVGSVVLVIGGGICFWKAVTVFTPVCIDYVLL